MSCRKYRKLSNIFCTEIKKLGKNEEETKNGKNAEKTTKAITFNY